MVNGLGVVDVTVRYEVSSTDKVEVRPNQRKVVTWVPPPRRPKGERGIVTAVSAASLAVRPGEIVALLGPSGSGKSSLLRAIAGLEPLAAGRITWNGEDITDVPTHQRSFGMMFQDPALFPSLDVGRNIAYGLHRTPKNRRAAIVEETLELVGLPGFARRKVTELSGGQAQRVALARSLAPSPRLLLLDEPLSALDRGLREYMVDVLDDVLRDTGITAVYVTHDQDEAFALADRVAILSGGAVLQFGATEELWRRPSNAEVATFLGYSTFLTAADAEALGLAGLAERHLIALGPESLSVDPGGLRLPVTSQKMRRGYVQVTVALPSGQPAELRVPEKLGAAAVGVRTAPDAVAVIGA